MRSFRLLLWTHQMHIICQFNIKLQLLNCIP
jgi:hypothetical protein